MATNTYSTRWNLEVTNKAGSNKERTDSIGHKTQNEENQNKNTVNDLSQVYPIVSFYQYLTVSFYY